MGLFIGVNPATGRMRLVTMATLPSLPTCLLLLLLTTSSCADGPPPPAASTTRTEDLGALPITEDTVASDQIEYTLEKNPEVPANDAPQRAVTPAPTPVAPPPPTNARTGVPAPPCRRGSPTRREQRPRAHGLG